jgi:SAM-dependent methyltransferase
MTSAATVFDAAADSYDKEFSQTLIGGMMRRAVWARCRARFTAGSRVLEMNCGTGEDARWLAQSGMTVLATDAAPEMVRVAQAKLDAAGVPNVRLRCLAWEQLETLDEGPFDAMLSNFGGLNCVEDLRAAAAALAGQLRSGAAAILCIMGPCVPWEWLWYLPRGRPDRAFRRLGRRGTSWQGLRIRYPSIRQTREAFAPEFRVVRVSALGALLPPPYAGKVLAHAPGLVRTLNRLERSLETVWPLPALADHYVVELLRR